jgi:putative Mg2+ transporter-C (MgtC) family protein
VTEWDALLRMTIAAIVGGVIGFERETLDKAAGLRTHMLVSLGAAVFMAGSLLLVEHFKDGPQVSQVDPTRIASTIVTGVGFLGGGIIFKSDQRVRGLTTAAGLWVVAAIGMAIGAGFYITGVGATVIALVILVGLRRVESRMDYKPDNIDRNLPEPD